MKNEKLSDVKLLRYIGRIAIAFCELEDELETGVSRELHDDYDDMGYLVTCKMNFQQKVELYERLLGHRLTCCDEKTRIPKFEAFVSQIKEMQDFRNNVIHGIRFNDDGELFLRQRYKKSLMNYDEGIDELKLPLKGMNSQYPKYKKITLNEVMLKKFLKKIEDTCEEFSEWEMQ
ncbi:MAG: hypothetical protein WC695_03400 [Candidatus Omnitrophota bacterium]